MAAKPESFGKAERPRRSALYLPASSARAVEKARGLACDVVILDLEDMVGPSAKAEARAAAVRAVADGGFGARELVIRVNGLDTPWAVEDLAAARQARPDAVLVPKVARPQDLLESREALGAGVALWAMIETSGALLRLDALGEASRGAGAEVWVVGAHDLAKDIRCALTPDRGFLQPALSSVVIGARAHGLGVLDGIFADPKDPEAFAAQCRQGAGLGFDGKTLVHPNQVAEANLAFSPSAQTLAWAQAVAAAYAAPENARAGVLEVDGRLVERAHLVEANRLIAIARSIAAIQG